MDARLLRPVQPSRVLAWLCGSGRRTWVSLWLTTAVVFALTSHWWTGQVSDAVVASWPSWQLAHYGTLDLAGNTGLPNAHGFEYIDGRLVAMRMMGVVLIAVPLNVLLAWTGLGAEAVGALTAATVSATAVANVGLLLRSLTSPRRAILGGYLLAFGTSTWTVASAELWTHGPTMMWLSFGLLLLSRDRLWLAGCALAPAILTRSHLAIAIAVLGLWIGWARRSVHATVALAVPAVAAVGILVAWNAWYFGHASLGGPYRGAVSLAVHPSDTGLADLAVKVLGTLVSGWCGVLLYSPFMVVLVLALPSGWRAAPDYARGAAIGGLGYLAVQLRVDIFSGGGTFYGNRLLLELLVLSAPLAAVGYSRWSGARPWRAAAMTSLAAVSVGIFAVGVLLADFRVGGTFSEWTSWYPVVVVEASGLVGALVVPPVVLVVLLVVRDSTRTARASGLQARLEVEQPAEQPVDEPRRLVGRE